MAFAPDTAPQKDSVVLVTFPLRPGANIGDRPLSSQYYLNFRIRRNEPETKLWLGAMSSSGSFPSRILCEFIDAPNLPVNLQMDLEVGHQFDAEAPKQSACTLELHIIVRRALQMAMEMCFYCQVILEAHTLRSMVQR